MIDSISERLVEGQEHAHRPAYAASYRANAACTRELGRLLDLVAAGADAWHAGGEFEKPVVKRSPGRCSVQFGPVALTIAWLQSPIGTVADGELLVVVWRGAVGARTPRDFERTLGRQSVSSATSVWEEVLTVEAASEDAWRWITAGAEGVTSAALADRCVGRLRSAYAESHAAH